MNRFWKFQKYEVRKSRVDLKPIPVPEMPPMVQKFVPETTLFMYLYTDEIPCTVVQFFKQSVGLIFSIS